LPHCLFFSWNSSSDLTRIRFGHQWKLYSIGWPLGHEWKLTLNATTHKTRSRTRVEKLQLSAPKPHSYTRTENPPRTLHLHLRLSLRNLFLRSGISIKPQRLPSS
jgi:hypothetical protein